MEYRVVVHELSLGWKIRCMGEFRRLINVISWWRKDLINVGDNIGGRATGNGENSMGAPSK